MRIGVRATGLLLAASTLASAAGAASGEKSCGEWVAVLKEPSKRAAALSEIGPAAQAAKVSWCADMVPLFVEALRDADGDTRFRAALSLKRLAGSSPANAAALRPHLAAIVAAKGRLEDEASPFIATALQEAIGHLGAPAVPHLLADLKKPGLTHIGYNAAIVLGRIGPPAAAALPAMEAALEELFDDHAREKLQEAIRSIRGK